MVDRGGGSGLSLDLGQLFARPSEYVGLRVRTGCALLRASSAGAFVTLNEGALCGGTGGPVLNDVAVETGRPRGPCDCILASSCDPDLGFLLTSSSRISLCGTEFAWWPTGCMLA